MKELSHCDKSIVLLSGGLDSSTTLSIAKKYSNKVYALTVDYGQMHHIEIAAAKAIADKVGVEEHIIVSISATEKLFATSALLNPSIAIPMDGVKDFVPVTYVPCRNIVLLGLAAGWSETLDAPMIYIGVNSQDYSGYPDCRPDFINNITSTINVGSNRKRYVQVEAPLQYLTKKDIVLLGTSMETPYELTWSCYNPQTDSLGYIFACGTCDSCRLRLKGFREAGLADPIRYMPGEINVTGTVSQ